MPLELVTPPAVEPVTLDEAKAHLKVDTTDDDALITNLIGAARARAEWHTGRAFITQSWMLWLDAWPCGMPVEIPLLPVQAVSAVTTYAPDGTPAVLDTALYQVDVTSARVALKPGAVLPTLLRPINAVSIAFTAGYGDAETNVPPLVRQGILDIAADLYTNRGDGTGEMPLEALALLAPYRILKI
ncbi:MAG TPA: head-tail connector protein [Rhizomicrobium sp.]|nr:head-tail connector protein [Rhizomicrobium sp.]